ncbi:hypothetical protein GV819_04220 [Pseudomonas sp. Fl5BN2]|uniref:hypothetical protein n=1 Tax=unclassified Pseudomonas TaxID=196821 RepID=UPI0013767312|nr:MULTISPECIES: hypothetical protein [unclassified Pseudomonas]NBF01491.1 hypothetical protein [Pseudomonas sp. Fl5BN2]NBF08381.1 hypothetical protein [Pseudomonas sp. Fl4BN1]
MILKQIYLYPDLVEFHNRAKDTSIIRDQTRHICNYLERQLSSLKFNSEKFNKICIIGYSNPQNEMYVASTNALAVPIGFDIDHCRSTPKELLARYYIDLLIDGLKKASSAFDIPLDHLLEWLDDFKAGGLRNEWVFKDKNFRHIGIRCRLDCSMTLDEFKLKLHASKKERTVFERVILITPPDEVAFHYRFKDILIEDEKLVITTRINTGGERILYSAPLSELQSMAD